MLTGGDFTTLSGRLFQASMMTVLLKSTFSDRVWRVRLPCCCYRVGHITSQHCLRHCGRLKPVSRILGSFTHTHACLTALFPGLPRWAGTRKVKPIWILLKQETVSGSGISWAVCKSAPCCRQTTTPAPHHSVFLQAGCPSCCPTNSVKALVSFTREEFTTRAKFHSSCQCLMRVCDTSDYVDHLHF